MRRSSNSSTSSPNANPYPMELKEFVTKTILDIVDGVRDAQRTDSTGAGIGYDRGELMRDAGFIEFDVAVTETQGEKNGRGISVSAPGIAKLGLGTSENTGTTKENRVRFKVPIFYPEPSKVNQTSQT